MTTHKIESNEAQKLNLKEVIEPLLKDLLYPSESDEAIEFVEILSEEQELMLDEKNICQVLGYEQDTAVESASPEDFFAPITSIKDWYGEEEKQAVADAQEVQKIIMEQLSNLQAYRLGETEIAVWLLGQDSNCNWKGLKTLVVET